MRHRIACAVLTTASVLMLLLLPMYTSPSNVYATCGSLLSGGELRDAAIHTKEWLFGVHRLERTCEVMRQVQWAEIAVAAGMFAGTAVELRRRKAQVALLAGLSVLALLGTIEGPLVPAGLTLLAGLIRLTMLFDVPTTYARRRDERCIAMARNELQTRERAGGLLVFGMFLFVLSPILALTHASYFTWNRCLILASSTFLLWFWRYLCIARGNRLVEQRKRAKRKK